MEKTRAAAATSEEPVKKMEDNPSFTMRPNASFALHFLKEESAAAGRLTDSKKDESYKIQFLKDAISYLYNDGLHSLFKIFNPRSSSIGRIIF